VEYPVTFLELLSSMQRKKREDNKPFRYVHIGGAVSEQDQDKALWYYQKARRTRVGCFLSSSLTNCFSFSFSFSFKNT